MNELIEKPIKPQDDDCCGGSCDPCVWDIFYEDLSAYRKQQRASNELADKTPNN